MKKISESNKNITFLKLLLTTGALGWGVCIVGIFLPWRIVTKYLLGVDEITLSSDQMLDYWFRMVCGGFFLIGFIFAITAYNPMKYWIIIPLLGWLNIIEGIIIGIHGLRVGLAPFPFYIDTGFCLFTGIGIIFTYSKLKGVGVGKQQVTSKNNG